MWIQHELQASQDVWFYCGRKNIRLKLVNDVLNILHKMHADQRQRELSAVPRDSSEATLGSLKTDESMLITSAAIKLHVLKRRKGNETLAGLLKGAYIFRKGGLEETDPCDRSFTLLGISADAADLHLAPDYSKSKARVFTDVAMALIGQIGIEVLTWCNFTLPSGEDQNQPSWVPDWSSPFSRLLPDLGRKPDFRYMASGDSTPHFQFLNTSNEFPTLCVSGIQVDNILVAGMALPRFPVSDLTWLTNDQDPNYQLQLGWLSDIEQLSKHCENVYGSSQALEDALWRTPITDLESTSAGEYKRASRAVQKGYQLYRTGFFCATMKRIELEQRSDDIRLVVKYWRPMVTRSSGRKYFVSQRGYLGVGPMTTLQGDVIAIMFGMNIPLVLRPVGGDHYQIVGEAYVHGIMDGEVMKDSHAVQEFKIC